VLKVFRKLLILVCVLASQISFGAQTLAPATHAPNTKVEDSQKKDGSAPFKNIFSSGKIHAYVGLISENEVTTNVTVNNTSTAIASTFKLKSPAPVIGFDFLPFDINNFKVGLGFMYEMQRSISSFTQSAGTVQTTTIGKSEKIRVSTLSALVEREIVNNFSILAGLNMNFVSVSGFTTANYETSSNTGIQIGGAYTYNNIRAQMIYKTVSGDITSTGKGAGLGVDTTGTYDYDHLLFTVGLIF
jgi:hypothetical protein